MESFFLAETTKYLYLLFDPDNFIHNDGRHGKVWNTAGGRECIIDAGGYVFNTEAHPIDPGVLHCCYTADNNDWSHRQQTKYQRLLKSSISVQHKKNGLNKDATTVIEAGKNNSSASGHRFTMDDSSVYWTQQANEDQRPQFKNHQKPTSAEIPAIKSLHPPPTSPSIYQTDDQHDHRREDNSGQFWQREEDTSVTISRSPGLTTPFSALHPDNNKQYSNEHNSDLQKLSTTDKMAADHDNDNHVEQQTTTEHTMNNYNEESDVNDNDVCDEDCEDNERWEVKQHRRMEGKSQNEDDIGDSDDNGYQLLTCRVTNNFYTNFRW